VRCALKLIPVVLAAAALGGCYTRDVSYKPFFSGIEDAKMNAPPVLSGPRLDPSVAPDDRIVIDHKDGSVTLVSRNAQHLMKHIERTLTKDERDLFTAQVLSEQTRAEYRQRGLDAGGAFDTLKEREHDVRELFRRMPMGEHSPNVIMKKLGDGLYRVRLTGKAADGLEWTSFDMTLEGGGRMVPLERDGVPVLDKKTGKQVEVMAPKNWRLVWFGR
jgi:hypothetical protein